jgi:erythromycin esterase
MPIRPSLPRFTSALLCLALALPGAMARAQAIDSLTPLRSTDAADPRDDDLAAFGRAVGGARIVALGEQTHGDGNVFALKVRLVQYLHRELGFDVLALESGLFDGARVQQLAAAEGRRLRDAAPGSLFFMYSTTREVKPLFDYIDAQRGTPRPLRLATFDSQHSGAMSQQHLLKDLAEQLRARSSALTEQADWALFAARTQQLLDFKREAPGAAERQRFFAMLDAARQAMATDASGFWPRVLASLDGQARNFWGQVLPEGEGRERAMADNLLWLMQRHAGRKIIVWGHDFHVGKHNGVPGLPGAMERVRKARPDEGYYHLFFTGFDGQTLDFDSGKTVPVRHHADSLEGLLRAQGAPAGFVDLRTGMIGRRALSAIGLSDYEGRYDEGRKLLGLADGVFYLDRIVPAVRE